MMSQKWIWQHHSLVTDFSLDFTDRIHSPRGNRELEDRNAEEAKQEEVPADFAEAR